MAEDEVQEWIEAPDRWGNDEIVLNDGEDPIPNGADLFQTDPQQTFRFDVTTPSNQETTQLQLSGYKLDSENTDQSTGVTLWQAAILLGEYLQTKPSLVQNKSVLELGAGLGLCGIVAHHLEASRSVLTDGDKFALEKLRDNIAQNSVPTNTTMECQTLFWGKTLPRENEPLFDVILGADVIYGWESFEPLLDTVVAWMKDDGQFLLSWKTHYNGVPIDTIRAAASARNLSWNEVAEGIYALKFQDERKQSTV